MHTHPLLGPEKFDEALSYIDRHRLYSDGLHVWNGYPDKLPVSNPKHVEFLFFIFL